MKKAFTLAEVLITLMILGVIATIVIPATISRVHKHQVEVQLKSAYTTLANAINAANANNDNLLSELAQSEQHIDTNEYAKYIFANLNCVNKEDRYEPIKNFGYAQIKTLNGNDINQARYLWTYLARCKLNNGMYVGILPTNSYDFVVDINGEQPPNRYGYDVFTFSIDKFYKRLQLVAGTGGMYLCYTNNNYNNKGIAGCQMGGNSTNIYCNEEISYMCAVPIMQNNWKIPDDYPVKF